MYSKSINCNFGTVLVSSEVTKNVYVEGIFNHLIVFLLN